MIQVTKILLFVVVLFGLVGCGRDGPSLNEIKQMELNRYLFANKGSEVMPKVYDDGSNIYIPIASSVTCDGIIFGPQCSITLIDGNKYDGKIQEYLDVIKVIAKPKLTKWKKKNPDKDVFNFRLVQYYPYADRLDYSVLFGVVFSYRERTKCNCVCTKK